MMLRHILSCALITAVINACGASVPDSSNLREAWDAANDPQNIASWNHSFAGMPLEGRINFTPWTDTYWPSRKAGVAQRWQSPGTPHFSYTLKPQAELMQMSSDQIAKLSPAEKYDILSGSYGYPTVNFERKFNSPDAPGWNGICHGWSAASLNYKEPAPVTLRNRHGIEVPFGSSDIKALLIRYEAHLSMSMPKTIGLRCMSDLGVNPGDSQNPECRDTNAGAFHIALINLVGTGKPGMIIDRVRGEQVWNHPVYRYRSLLKNEQPPSPGAAPGTHREIRIETVIDYVNEVEPQWEPHDVLPAAANASIVYSYRLELDPDGNIIGGEWESSERPDFVWHQAASEFPPHMKALKDLYELSTVGQ